MKNETVKDYKVGETAFVHAFGHWYEGKVVKVGRTKVHVEYTSGTGTTRTKSCSMNQVSKVKLEGERKEIGSRKRDRHRQRDAEFQKALEEGRVSVEVKIEWKHHLDPIRCHAAFQALQMPSGFFKGTTHARAREIIEDCTGIKVKKGRRPERGQARTLEEYIAWASEPGNCDPIDLDDLPPGRHDLHISPKQGEQAAT
jgi:hypothetical protein